MNVCGPILSILADNMLFSFSGMIATFSNIELALGSVKIPHLKWMEEPVHILIPGRVMQVTDEQHGKYTYTRKTWFYCVNTCSCKERQLQFRKKIFIIKKKNPGSKVIRKIWYLFFESVTWQVSISQKLILFLKIFYSIYIEWD